jgi:uncharacterized RDD family membrane protein YckC
MNRSFAESPVQGSLSGSVYSGFGSRFIAYIIDSLFLGLIALVVGLSAGIVAHLDHLAILNTVSTVAAVITPLYYVSFWALAGATPGKIMLGMKIVGPNGAMNGIGWGRAILRLLGYVVSSFFLYIGFLWIAIDGERRGWHDHIAGTRVVNV